MSSETPLDVFTGTSDMARLMRAQDWSSTSLGDPARWPQSLRAALSICIGSRFPIAIYWGPDLVLLYNEAWSPIPGNKHPWALGRPAAEVWPEIWDTIGPLFAQVRSTGEATYVEDALLLMHRHGYTEECYFNYTFTPIRGESGEIQGVFNAVIETTYRVIGERRTELLGSLGERIAGVRSADEACRLAVDSLVGDGADVPFCLIYALDTATTARLVAVSGVPHGHPAALPRLVLSERGADTWPVPTHVDTAHIETVSDLPRRFTEPLSGGPWPEPAQAAMIAPIRTGLSEHPFGFLVLGASPRRAVDNEYLEFAGRAASQIATAVANATAYQRERDRAESLAALDRAKTAFFSNISHEFRTPLTLMLGPLEDILATPATEGAVPHRDMLTVVHRNSLRLLKMVNGLLDFSRLEAGRMQGLFAPTDISVLTAELASVFRSVIEKAGIRLVVDCPAIDRPVFLDRDLWEKIVLNLLSNAFKFTFDGEIEVRLRRVDTTVELTVRDTGVGIAADHMPRIFERFHRVEGTRGRSFEGSGIGLALVHELAKLHGGSARVESDKGRGSVFTITIPLGSAHLPPEHVRSTPASSSASIAPATYADEAHRWLPDADTAAAVTADLSDALAVRGGNAVPATERRRVLLADDNADVRMYVRALLGSRYDVEAVENGEAALAAARARRPDLVLSDVMMPGLDGFALLAAIRGDAALRDVPVILLSARAGEDASVEGVEAGADDYLVKPFSARELVARVTTHLELARVRREAADRITMILESSTDTVMLFDAEGRFTYLNPVGRKRFADQGFDPETLIGARQFVDVLPDAADSDAARALARARLERVVTESEMYYQPWGRWFADRFYPTHDGGVACFSQDVTERKRAEEAVRRSEERFRTLVVRGSQCVWRLGPGNEAPEDSPSMIWWEELTGAPREALRGWNWLDLVHPDDRERTQTIWQQAMDQVTEYNVEYRVRARDGSYRWLLTRGVPVMIDAHTHEWIGTQHDITDRKHAEQTLRDSEERYRLTADAMPQLVWSADATGVVDYVSARASAYSDVVVGSGPHQTRGLVHPDDLAETLAVWGDAVRTGKPYAREHRLRMADGHYRWHLSRAEPVKIGAGPDAVIRWIGTATDVHELRVTQESLRINEERLREADRKKDEFLAILAHELRNPLAPIRTGLELIRLGAGKPGTIERIRPMMERQVGHMVRLIDDLLDVSRITSGKIQLQREPTLIVDLVHSAIEANRAAIDAAGIELDVHLPALPCHLHVDRIRLVQVLSNLLHNSVKFTEPGGRISVSAAVVAGDTTEHELALTVADTGSGISAAVLPHVFDLFVQGDHAGRGKPGLGIGLALARRLTEMHGGRISASSDGPGRGTSFLIRMPVADPSLPLERVTSPDGLPQAIRRRVLIIDDNLDAADTLAELVRELGGEAVTANDGDTGARRAAEFLPDVVLLDIGMPDIDGYETCQLIRQACQYPVFIVALTGWGQEQDKDRALESGFDAHLTKPADPSVLARLLAEPTASAVDVASRPRLR